MSEFSPEVREEITKAYNFLFYGMDSDLVPLLGLDQFDKKEILRRHSELRRSFSDGAPIIRPLPRGWRINIPDPPHGGPAGYELSVYWLHQEKRRLFKGPLVMFNLFHEGSGYVEDGLVTLNTSPEVWTKVVEETTRPERPMVTSDLIPLKAAVNLVRSAYQAVFPHSYDIQSFMAARNGINIA